MPLVLEQPEAKKEVVELLMRFPPMPCPFPVRIHPQQQRLELTTAAWLPVLPGGADLVFHRYDRVHARMWPEATWQRLWLASRLLLHMWWIDDILDDPSDGTAAALARSHLSVLASATQQGCDDGSGVLAALLAEADQLMPPRWQRRIRALYRDYLMTSVAHRDDFGVTPKLCTYLRLRPLMGGMFYATALTELVYNCPLPAEKHLRLQALDVTMRVNHICCWANDLYAHAREAARGDAFNLVTVLIAHHNMTRDQAVDTIADLTNAELATLEFLAAPTREEILNRYFCGLKDMVAAILSWSADTERYRAASREPSDTGKIDTAPAATA